MQRVNLSVALRARASFSNFGGGARPPRLVSGGRDALSYGVSFATTRSHQLARGCDAAPGISAWSLIPWAAWVPKTGAAKARRARSVGVIELFMRRLVNLSCRPYRARASFLNSGPARRRLGPPRRCSGCGGGRTRSATGSASPPPDRTSWLRGSPACFSPRAFRAGSLDPLGRVGAEESGAATKNKAIANQSPLLKLSLRRVRFQRTSTRQQLDCAKTL